MEYYVPKTNTFQKYLGKTISRETFHKIKETEKLEKIDKAILSKAYEEQIDLIFKEKSYFLSNTAVVLIGKKNKLYGYIINPEEVKDSEWTFLSQERFRLNITYVDSKELTRALNS